MKKKAIILLIFLVFALLIVLHFTRQSIFEDTPEEDYTAGEMIVDDNYEDDYPLDEKQYEPEEIDHDEPSDIDNEVEEPREPVVFCGLADPDYATDITNEEALDYLVLVNRCQRMGSDFSPHDLRLVDVPQINNWSGDHSLRESAATALEELFAEINAIDGMNLVLSSAYRSYELQTFFHTNAVNNMGRDEARRVSAVPGHSEHQLGLAADVTIASIGLSNAFSSTAEGIWVRENAHRFGFIISYPYGRTEDTGFIYEPWHIRYVGIDAATTIFEQNLILEEFLWYHN